MTVELKYNDLSTWKWNSDKQATVFVNGQKYATFVGIRPKRLISIVRTRLGVKRVKSLVTQKG